MRHRLKKLLGAVPFSAELYQRHLAAGQPPANGYELSRLEAVLPTWLKGDSTPSPLPTGANTQRILVFGGLRWWVEYTVALSLLLERLGHEITLAYLPFRRWTEPVLDFDRRRQSEYMAHVLEAVRVRVNLIDLSKSTGASGGIDIQTVVEEQAKLDVQYSLQYEDIDLDVEGPAKELYSLRLDRNWRTARSFYQLARRQAWDTVVLPNGSILEFGIMYRIAKSLGLRVVTFEFGEQRERIWLAENDEVMRLDTHELWGDKGEDSLTDDEIRAVSELYTARTAGRTWGNFKRSWQAGQAKGGPAIRQQLGLATDRHTVLLCTNVVGDSLALNRQLFTNGMADWLAKTVKELALNEKVNLVVRVHPGELLGAGHPSIEIIQATMPKLPENVHLIPPDSDINTYDLIDLADLGLVYTTTVGLEMAMRGIPVIVAGQTHYRGKGFTFDPESLDDYFGYLNQIIADPSAHQLSQDQVDRAWHYAYLFFFEYPKPFPWHLIDFWDDVTAHPLAQMVQPHQMLKYKAALDVFTNARLDESGFTDG